MMDGDIKLFAVSSSTSESEQNSDDGQEQNAGSGSDQTAGNGVGPLATDNKKMVFTNKDAPNSEFLPSFQITQNDIREIEFYAPEMIREIKDAKGKIRLDFENTTSQEPGSFSIDAGFIGEFGKKTASGNRVANIKKSETGTDTVVNLLAYSETDTTWLKGNLAASDFKAPNEGEWDLYVAKWSPSEEANSEDSIEVAILVERSLTVNVNTNVNSAMSLAGSFFDYFGMDAPDGDGAANIGGGTAETVTEGQVLDKSDQTDDFVLSGSDGDNEMIGGAGSDFADGGAGADTLDGGAGSDIVKGGAGDDIIDGGANGIETYQDGEGNIQYNPVWEWGDRAIFDGKMADYTITSNGSGTFTVTDTNTDDGDDGTDTLTGIEILQFSDNDKLLVADTGSFSFTDHYTGQTISEDYAHGTDFGDLIAPTLAGRSVIQGGAGNDIIIGDPSSGGGQDHISGDSGNDFIDGAGRGTSAMPWENDNIAGYSAPGRSFKWELGEENNLGLTAGISKITYSGDGVTELNSLATALNMDITDRFVADQEYWVISDKSGDEGLGTDILTNIDELRFNDSDVRLSVFKDPWGGFIDGTDFADTILGEGVSEFIEGREGNDRIFGGAGSDEVNLGRGDDFFDGGLDSEDFDTEAYMTNLGGNFGDFKADEFFGDKFAIPVDGGAGGGTGGSGAIIVSPGALNYPVSLGTPISQSEWSGMFLGEQNTFQMVVYEVMVDGANLPMMIIQGMSGVGIPDDTLVQVQDDGSGGYDFMPGISPADFSSSEDMGELTAMTSAIGAAQVRGDTVLYDGDFDRYTVTAYDGGDATDTSSELFTVISNKFSDVDISEWTSDDTVVVVQDTNTGSKSFGTDVLINAERIQFDDQEYLLSVQTDVNSWSEYRWNHSTMQDEQVTMGEANWRGTFSDDTINSSSLVVDGESSAPETDRMDGQAGDDILISGAGGDRLIGGIGNDILDGGANGSTGDSWRDSDVAEYSGSIDRFTLEKVIFEGKNLNISDDQGNGVFVVKAVTKGDNVIGQISKVGSSAVLYQVDKGETFVVVKDSLPLAYGGVGTDILLGMEKAQFGFDWEGEVEFQVKYEVNSWGGGEGEVRGEGTLFDDVIDLRAGKASDNAGGYGGFDDFNDGADIWDGDAFFTTADAAKGFDIWNWQPKSTDTALTENLTSLRDFSDANDVDFGSDVSISIYKVLDGSTERWIAFDTENQWVLEEVKETSTSGVWKIHYDGAAVDAIFAVQDDAWNWQPSESDTAVATGVNVAWDDGYVDTTMTFDIYLRGTDEYVAYDTQWNMVFDIVEGNVTDGWTFKPYEAFDKSTNEVSDGVWSWAPGDNDNASAIVSKIVHQGESENYEMEGNYAIYEYETGKFLAYDLDWDYVKDAVKLDNDQWVIDMGDTALNAVIDPSSGDPSSGDPSSGYPSSGGQSSGSSSSGRIHNSWIEGGRGNDIIMAGQGRDEITGGAGNDFIDGGSESDFLAAFVGTTALLESKQLTDPDTGRSGIYSVYEDSSGVKWAWDGNQATPSYFKVEVNGSEVSQLKETVDASFYNDRWSSYDRAHFSGDQIRYSVSEVYLKISAGRPDLTVAGEYQELSVAEYKALEAGKTDYKLVVKVVDALPAAAGGDGTDYLINVEEAQFYDGHEQLEVDSFSWAYESMVSPTDRMTDAEISNAAAQEIGITQIDYAGDYGGQRQLWGDSNTTWKVLTYSGDDTLESGVYALVQVNSDNWGSWTWHDSYVVSNGSGGWKEYSAVSYEGSSRGTIKNDTITSLVRDQKDEIFGKGGDDLIAAGAGTDRIMGGTGDDVIWGGANVASNSWDYQGDIAFFSGSEARYTVIRDVLVKGDENGAVEKDSSGNIKLYSNEILSVSAKGVVSASTDSSTLISNGTSGYHTATIVIDSLSDAAGGDGIDVLVGIEGLLFGFLSSGDHGWLPSASGNGGNYSVWTETGEKSLTTLAISYMAEDFVHWDHNPNTDQWNEVQKYKVNYTGTNFDDEISFDNTTTFKSEVGSSFTSSDATTYTFNGGSGDDSFIGSSASGVKSVAVYSGAKAAYDIEEIGNTNVFTVTHKIPDALGGTGIDTLTNIDAVKFGYQTSSEEIVRLNVETGKWDGGNRYFKGTMFNDEIKSDAGDFSGLLAGNDNFIKLGGGVDTIYAGAGEDSLHLDGFYSRYEISYNATEGHLELKDSLSTSSGGDGSIFIKNVESVDFYESVFRLRVDTTDLSKGSSYQLYMEHPEDGYTRIAQGHSIDADGKILIENGLGLFDISETPALHAPTYSWEQMLGSSVGTLADPFDMNVDIKPFLDGTTDNIAPDQFGNTEATQTAGMSVDINQTSITDFSSFDGTGSSADISATKNVYEGSFQGFGNDDVMYGGAGNDTFFGGPGNDVFNGRGENQTDWWDSFNTGDTAIYMGVQERYSISGPLSETDTNRDGFTDGERGFKVDTVGDTLSYFTVTDSLAFEQGGDGIDYLINIEKIRFQDGDYHLSIRDVGNSWDSWTQLFGTSGDDDFTSYTDDSADPGAKEYNINGGAGNDLIIGGSEPVENTSWGDSAVYEAQEQNFDISIEELTYVADGASATDDWNGDGKIDSADTTLSGVLKAKFGSETINTINKVTVQDTRADEAGGLGTDTLYGIEHIEYRSGYSGSHVDLAPRSEDWDGDKIVDSFSGTAYGDVFTSDEGRQDVQGRAGDDIIITGASGDYINPGEGNDYVNSGIGETVDSNDSWASRDDVNFHSVSYARVEVEKVTLWTNDTTGRALETVDGKWSLSGYNGEAAKGSDLWEIFTGSTPTGYTQQSGFLVTDTLPGSEAGSIGTNLIVGVDSIGFSDEYLDVKPFSDTWSWTDWFTGETISESFQKGTPFADIGTDSLVGGSGSDTLEGKAGNDAIFGGAGGDRLNGGKGNDILDGGENGSTGDDWRDSDRAEYNGIEARYNIYQVKVDASAIRTNKLTDDSSTTSVDESIVTIYDTGSKISGGTMDGYTVVQGPLSGVDPASLSTAYIVSDALGAALGGTGNDLLIDVETVQFQESQVDLGLRIRLDNWDGNNSNGYDWVEVTGTDGADDISAWGNGVDLDGDGNANDDINADSEIRGKGGDDVIYGYGGGDRINGGTGNDYIDGGADGVADAYGWARKDEAIFDGPARNYTVTQYSGTDSHLLEIVSAKFSSLDTSDWGASDQFTVVVDDLPSAMGGTGTDILRNIEFINFQDKFVALTMEEFIDYDGSGNAVRAFVDGTDGNDTIGVAPDTTLAEGAYNYSGNDDLLGNDGNDIIYGGAGGDYITPGAGDDIIDGGADGVDLWSGQAMSDVVRFSSNYADYEIEDADVDGVQVITVTDTDPDGDGSSQIRNVETLEFADMSVNIGVTSFEMINWEGNTIGASYQGSIFGDTITGTSGSDHIYGGKGADVLNGGSGPDRLEGGLGNDTIYGGANGLDEWGNAGEDVAIFSGNESDYTVSFYDSDGESATSYQDDGYIKVVDSRTTDGVAEGTDKLYGVEGIEFADNFVSFYVNNSFTDLDGDGKADVGGQRGTSGADTLTGSDLAEKLEGKGGNDALFGGGGADFINGGTGADMIIGGDNAAGEMDIAQFDTGMSTFTIAQDKWIAKDSSGNYETDSSGDLVTYDSDSVSSGYSAVKAYSFTTTENDTSVVDILAEIEGIEFSDGFARFDVEAMAEDLDFDGTPDFGVIGGGISNDNLGASTIDNLASYESWANATTLFAADNYIDGGYGSDTINAGAGDDVINPGDGSGNSDSAYKDFIDGGDGNDTVTLLGNAADWSSAASSETDANSQDGYTKYTYNNTDDNTNIVGLEVYIKNVEAIEYEDGVVTSQAIQTDIDRDGDGTTDERNYKGTTSAENMVATGNTVDTLDAGAGNDVMSAGNGADTLIDGAGSDLLFGGANTGTDEKGRALKDTAVFNGTKNSVDSDGDGEIDVAADYAVSDGGVVLCTGFNATTGECTVVTVSGTTVSEVSDANLSSSVQPTIFSSAVEVYVATTAETYDRVVSGTADGTKDRIAVTESDGSTAYGTGYVVDHNNDGKADIFTGSSDTNFDSDNMTLTKVHQATHFDGSANNVATLSADITADATSLTVNSVTNLNASGGSIKIGSEIILYKGITVSDTANTLTGLTRGAEGTTAAVASSSADVDGGTSVIVYDAHEKLEVYTVTKGSDTDTLIGIEQIEFKDEVVELTAQEETTVSFSVTTGLTEITTVIGSGFADEMTSSSANEIFSGGNGSDIYSFDDGTGTDQIKDFSVSEDVIEVKTSVNGTSISAAADILSRVTSTSDGALINLGTDDAGVAHTILLQDISVDDLTAANFSAVEIL